MRTKKDRRHSGRIVTTIYNPVDFPYEFTYWDDWNDYRDGMRNPFDRTLKKSNYFYAYGFYMDSERRDMFMRDLRKIKIKEKIRKVRKEKLTLKSNSLNR